MDKELRILILEDNSADAELEEYELRRSGLVFTSKIVDTEEAFVKELEEFSPDIILSDYDLPTFDGLAALRIAKEKCPDVPFIIVSGKLGEEFAIEKLKVGATDYVLKGNLKRLVPSVKRALEEAKERTERKRAEEKFRLLAEQSPNMIFINYRGRVVYANQKCSETMGYTTDEFYSESFDFRNLIATAYLDKVSSSFQKHMQGEEVPPDEYAILAKDGKRVEVIITTKLIDYENDKAILGTITDITERKLAEEKLKLSEEKYRTLVENMNDVLYHIDKNGVIMYISPSLERSIGYKPSDVIGKSFTVFIYKEDLPIILKQFEKILSGIIEPSEYRVIAKTGDIRWIYTSSRAVYEDGKVIGAQGILQDITERKRAEEALRDKERKISEALEFNKTILNTSSIGILTYKESGQCLYANDAAAKIAGTNVAGLLNQNFHQIQAWKKSGMYETALKALSTGTEQQIETHVLTTFGKDVWLSLRFSSFFLEGENHLLMFTYDITERKQAEEEINMLSAVVKQSTEGMAIADLDGNLTFVNDAWCKMHGYTTPGELLGKSLTISHNKEQIENDVMPFNRKLREIGTYSGEVGHITKDGIPFPTLMTSTILKDKQGKPYALIGIAKDITEHKLSQKALVESEQKYRTIVENLTDAFYIHDFQGRILDCNDNACRMVGYTHEELIGKNLSLIDSPENIRFLPKRMARIVAEGRGEFDGEHIRKDGSIVKVTISPSVISREGQGRMQSIVRDITDRKRAEEQIKRLNESMRLAMEVSKAGTWDWDIANNTFIWSPEFLRLFGMPPETLAGFEAWSNSVHPEEREIAAKRIQDSINKKTELLNDYRIILPNQEIRWIRAIGRTFYEKDTPVRMTGICIDITGLKQMEKELQD